MSSVKEAIGQMQYLTFYIAEEEYAIGILRVKKIIEYDIIMKVPGMPPSIRGVINLRGSVVPVIDLGVKFGLMCNQRSLRSHDRTSAESAWV